MMLIPEPWSENPHISKEKKALMNIIVVSWNHGMDQQLFHSQMVNKLVRFWYLNGLRPARYYVTKDDYIIFSSEVDVESNRQKVTTDNGTEQTSKAYSLPEMQEEVKALSFGQSMKDGQLLMKWIAI